MKTRTFGTEDYLVKSYYKNNGKIDTIDNWYVSADNAYIAYLARKRNIGGTYYENEGILIDVFVFKVRQCEFLND